MKKILVVFGCLICLPILVNAQNMGELNGDWTVASGTLAGANVPSSSTGSMTLKINGNTFDAKSGSLSSGGIVALAQEGSYQLNFIINRGADSGKTVRALYSLSGGVLTITFSQDDTFPVNQVSTAENKYCVLKYRKESTVAANDDMIVGEGNSGNAAAGLAR